MLNTVDFMKAIHTCSVVQSLPPNVRILHLQTLKSEKTSQFLVNPLNPFLKLQKWELVHALIPSTLFRIFHARCSSFPFFTLLVFCLVFCVYTGYTLDFNHTLNFLIVCIVSCFDTAGWLTGRASGL